MDRLRSQFQRLYALDEAGGLIGAEGHVRALVRALGRPADWRALAPVWQGVQIDLQPWRTASVRLRQGLRRL